MFVQSPNSVRHFVVRLERGDDLHESLLTFARTHGVFAAWVRATGSLEQCSLVEYDQHRKAFNPPRRFYNAVEAIVIEGNLSVREGVIHPRLSACVSRESDNGIEVLGGQLESARVFSLELLITVFEDLALVRTNDHSTGLPVWMLSEGRSPSAPARTTSTTSAAQEPSARTTTASYDPPPARTPSVVQEPPPAPPPPPPAPQVMMARGISAIPMVAPPTVTPPTASKTTTLGDVARQLESMPTKLPSSGASAAVEELTAGDILLHPRWEDVEVVRENDSGGFSVRLKNGSVRDISLEVFDLAAAPPRGEHKVWILRPKVRR